MKFINFSDIKINPEYFDLVPRMNVEDDRVFDDSIKNNGIRDSVQLNENNVLLDGHSRYKKAEKYSIKRIPYEVKKFDDVLLEKKYVIECNLERRHLNNFQKIELGIPLLDIEKRLSLKRRNEKLKIGNKTPIGSKDPNGKKGKTTEIVSKKLGLSNTTMLKGKTIVENAPKPIIEKLRKGKISINSAYNVITRESRNLPKVDLPVGKWSIVQVDLPIEFGDKGVRGSSNNNYDTMSLDECKTGIINGKDVRELFDINCVIFAWFQASTIFDAKDILESWGFKCITNRIWDKEIIGTGSWLANRHEHLVLAVKGKMPIPAIRLESLVRERRTSKIHSKKPVLFYDDIERMYPQRKYLDLYSRYIHNENWTCFGNQLEEAITV